MNVAFGGVRWRAPHVSFISPGVIRYISFQMPRKKVKACNDSRVRG